MRTPYVEDFAASLSIQESSAHALPEITLEQTPYGTPELVCGGNAVVFFARCKQRSVCLKCYGRNSRARQKLYLALGRYDLSAFTGEFHYYPDELTVFTADECDRYDVMVAERLRGTTLEMRVATLCRSHNAVALDDLCRAFYSFAYALLQQPWAHGDIKPDNIIVTDRGIKLIDFDAAFVPELAGSTAIETGSPEYNSPMRDTSMYDKHIDDWGLAIISLNLHLIRLTMPLTPESVVLKSTDFMSHTEPVDRAILQFQTAGDALAYTLARALLTCGATLPFLKERFCPTGEYTAECESFENGGRWGYRNASRIVVAPVWDDSLEHRGKAVCILGDKEYTPLQVL